MTTSRSAAHAHDEGYEDGYALGAKEGANAQDDAWRQAVALLTETLTAYGLLSGPAADDPGDLLAVACELARRLGHRLGRPVDGDRIPAEVSAQVWPPGVAQWRAAYTRALWRQAHGEGEDRLLADQAADELEAIGRALGLPDWELRACADAVKRGCGG